jgi:hypothetical protein
MKNAVTTILEQAAAERWCTRSGCGTCGAAEYQSTLLTLVKRDPDGYATDLARVEPISWYNLEDVGGAVGLAFAELPNAQTVDAVLRTWMMCLQQHTRLIDAVLFYVIRAGKASEAMRKNWMSLARAEALRTGDPSLLESLVYTLGPALWRDEELLDIARRKRRGHAPLHRALVRALGHPDQEA